METKKYAPSAGKNSTFAAELACRGDVSRALKKAALAADDLELMHPSSWGDWAEAEEYVFAQALRLISPQELAMLNLEMNRDGLSCFAFFAKWPGKLRPLLLAGIDNNAACSFHGVACGPVERSCFAGDFARLAAMMDAGGLSGDEFSPALAREAASRSKWAPKTCIQVLAAMPSGFRYGSSPVSQARVGEVVGWLSASSRLDKRNVNGLDALKIAIGGKNIFIANTLLDAGANPHAKDAKGRDAMAYFDDLARRSPEFFGNELSPAALNQLRERLRACSEQRELDGASACVSDARVKPRARSL